MSVASKAKPKSAADTPLPDAAAPELAEEQTEAAAAPAPPETMNTSIANALVTRAPLPPRRSSARSTTTPRSRRFSASAVRASPTTAATPPASTTSPPTPWPRSRRARQASRSRRRGTGAGSKREACRREPGSNRSAIGNSLLSSPILRTAATADARWPRLDIPRRVALIPSRPPAC